MPVEAAVGWRTTAPSVLVTKNVKHRNVTATVAMVLICVSFIGLVFVEFDGECRLTSRAQARGTNQREPRKGAWPHGAIRSRSGTGTAIPRCLQRFVRCQFHASHSPERWSTRSACPCEPVPQPICDH